MNSKNVNKHIVAQVSKKHWNIDDEKHYKKLQIKSYCNPESWSRVYPAACKNAYVRLKLFVKRTSHHPENSQQQILCYIIRKMKKSLQQMFAEVFYQKPKVGKHPRDKKEINDIILGESVVVMSHVFKVLMRLPTLKPNIFKAC